MTRANRALAVPGACTAARLATICFRRVVAFIGLLQNRSSPSNVSCAAGRKLGRLAPGDAAEHDAGDEAGAAAVVVVVEPAHDFAGGIEAADRRPRGVLHLG